MIGIEMFCTPTAAVFEGVNKSGDGRSNPNKLAWQVHDYVNSFSSKFNESVLSPAFVGWLMGYPVNYLGGCNAQTYTLSAV